MRSRLIAAAALIVVIGAVIAKVWIDGDTVRGGPVASTAGEIGVGAGFGADIGRPLTFADILLVNPGAAAATLDSVELVEATPGLRIVGALTAVARSRPDVGYGDDDYPPQLSRFVLRPDALGPLRPLEGTTLPPRQHLSRTDDGATLLAIGLEVDRAGISTARAVRIRYHVGETGYVRQVPYALALCAPRERYGLEKETCRSPDPLHS